MLVAKRSPAITSPAARAARSATVVVGYAALTLAMTWPLATRLTTSLPGDLGDPVFVAWVMAWVDLHLTRLLAGDLAAWGAMWNAPIFAPEPATLTYSEHFLAQAVQALPLWWATNNAVLVYNAVFLTTVTLTAVAAHGFTVRLSGSRLAGVVAALLCTFNDYRTFWTLGHLQVLSIHWWILGVWALDVFVETRSGRALAGATMAFAALHLSSTYLMAYCAPFTAALALWSLARHGRLADRRVWAGVGVVAAVAVAVVVPVLMRYRVTQDSLGYSRTVDEIIGGSASISAYAQALPWAAPLLLLALLGVVAPSDLGRLSRRARGVLLALAGAALVLAMGPVIQLGGRELPGPYGLLRAWVPGFEALRVPHRFVTVATTLLSVLSGMAATWLVRSGVGLALTVVGVGLVTRHGWQPPFPLDTALVTSGLAPSPEYLRPRATPPPIYRFVATTANDAIVAELPFGDLSYEIRYTFFTAQHRRRTVNGYSGVLPASFLARERVLKAPLANLEASWAALAPATHVVVHTTAWPDDTGTRVRAWLESRGARVVGQADGAVLYLLSPG